MKTTIISAAKVLSAMPLVLLLSGCATPANPSAMVPQTADISKSHPHSVVVAVSGGHSTNPMWTSRVSDEDFRTALQNAITQHRVFSQVVQSGSGEYRLDVNLLQLGQPLLGLDMTVTAEVAWVLTDTRSGRVVWREITRSAHTATVGDAFVGVTRLRLANEGAIRESIKTGIERISKLDI